MTAPTTSRSSAGAVATGMIIVGIGIIASFVLSSTAGNNKDDDTNPRHIELEADWVTGSDTPTTITYSVDGSPKSEQVDVRDHHWTTDFTALPGQEITLVASQPGANGAFQCIILQDGTVANRSETIDADGCAVVWTVE